MEEEGETKRDFCPNQEKRTKNRRQQRRKMCEQWKGKIKSPHDKVIER